MNRTAELGEYIELRLQMAADSLKVAYSDPATGVNGARDALRAARAVLKLLEPAKKSVAALNVSLGDTSARLTPIRNRYQDRTVPPPLGPSTMAEIQKVADEVAEAQELLPSILKKLKVPNSELVVAAGKSYRQARRRFLQALPDDDDGLIDLDRLDSCRKASQRVYFQCDALMRGKHTKRSDWFAKLTELMLAHRDTRSAGTPDGPSLSRLELEITKLGNEAFARKPSAYREWLAAKIED